MTRCSGCGGSDEPLRLTARGRWCPACMPAQPTPDPALTLDGLRTVAGIDVNTYPWCPALRRKPEPVEPAPLPRANLSPAAARVVDHGERITRERWLQQQARAADVPPDPRVPE